MPRSRRLLAILLLPLLAAGVGGLQWAHEAIAHGDAAAGGSHACSPGHASCGHAAHRADAGLAGGDAPVERSPSPCLDCDRLGEMLTAAAWEAEVAIAVALVAACPVAAESAEVTPSLGVHRARPPPIA